MAEAGVAADGTLEPAAGGLAGVRRRFSEMSGTRKAMLMVGLAALIAVAVGLTLWSRTPDYRILYTNIPDKDAGTILQALQTQNVPYKIDQGGTISVPADRVYDVRFTLASQGLPKAGDVGFELMDNQKFGISQFNEQVNYQRAVEGELGRSIETIQAVDKARIHLAMPRQTVFLRDQQKPTASVVLTLRPGRTLDSNQVAGIVHLVASAIPDLTDSNVSIVDQEGNLLSNNNPLNHANLDARQLVYVQEIEKNYVDRVQAILAPIVGKENVHAEVTAQVDFAEIEQTSETFKPNQASGTASLRSQQTLQNDGKTDAATAAGVPGALSNQPPGAAAAPITVANASDASSAAAAQGSSTIHHESTINYEVDKTVQHVKQPTGAVKRLSAAVVINYKPGKDATGKATFVPFTPAEMAQINNLVQESIGYNKDRGDSVNVVNTTFAGAVAGEEEQPMQTQVLTYIKGNLTDIVKLALVALAVIYLLLFVVRPLMRDLSKAREEPRTLELDLGDSAGLTEDMGDSEERVAEEQEENQRTAAFSDLLAQAKELARNDPRMVATILREWMSNEDDAAGGNPNKVG
ncbi:flagellar basal-body MS-ring/collar protein FliF [Amantichitinum ursilacus]|uniref:Flagellar M-ring protein n=1 Tax=Amantichitinum ursilacus TaxID=857265 RepID=A0A0N0GNS3_9NEIS|nr:flagellar basal-body MS-ring/collar protein FliF [Amantichitinum ursilacus]KPC53114.1 Flagellar M-ring protein [Amantichitinum ursilacus]